MTFYKRKLITSIPYSNVDFRWVSSHYDVHLNGSCIFNGKLYEFKTNIPEEDVEEMVDIYELNIWSKLKWYYQQWLFERCVGYHWSYPERKEGARFYYRKPKWFYMGLFNLYYRR